MKEKSEPYLDASVVVALFVIDPSSARAEAFLSANSEILNVSDFGAAELSSAVARRVRTRDLTPDEGRLAFSNFDSWLARSADRQETATADIDAASRILRRLDVNLRTPDALHIAIAQRIGATLVTFDHGMAAGARALGMAVAMP
jgi:predicted nucleic acid-binding protein